MLWKIVFISSCCGKNKHHSIYMLSSQRKVFYALFSLQAISGAWGNFITRLWKKVLIRKECLLPLCGGGGGGYFILVG